MSQTDTDKLLNDIKGAMGTNWARPEEEISSDNWTNLQQILFGDFAVDLERCYPHLVTMRELAEASRHFDSDGSSLWGEDGKFVGLAGRRKTAPSERTKARYQAYRDAVRSLILYP